MSIETADPRTLAEFAGAKTITSPAAKTYGPANRVYEGVDIDECADLDTLVVGREAVIDGLEALTVECANVVRPRPVPELGYAALGLCGRRLAQEGFEPSGNDVLNEDDARRVRCPLDGIVVLASGDTDAQLADSQTDQISRPTRIAVLRLPEPGRSEQPVQTVAVQPASRHDDLDGWPSAATAPMSALRPDLYRPRNGRLGIGGRPIPQSAT